VYGITIKDVVEIEFESLRYSMSLGSEGEEERVQVSQGSRATTGTRNLCSGNSVRIRPAMVSKVLSSRDWFYTCFRFDITQLEKG
jgi:hypothetical protein